MLNIEKYKNGIENILVKWLAISEKGYVCECGFIDCNECIFKDPKNCASEKREWLKSEYKEQILDKVERKYLSSVIGPFRDKVLYIQKASIGTDNIRIGIKNDNTINLPCFKKDTMYKGMKAWEKYTLEDLGI